MEDWKFADMEKRVIVWMYGEPKRGKTFSYGRLYGGTPNIQNIPYTKPEDDVIDAEFRPLPPRELPAETESDPKSTH